MNLNPLEIGILQGNSPSFISESVLTGLGECYCICKKKKKKSFEKKEESYISGSGVSILITHLFD